MTNHAHDPEFADRVRASFAKQHAMDLIHATLPVVEPGLTEIHLPHWAGVEQQHGFVHGGVVGMIADSAAGYAAMTLVSASASVLTVEYKMNLVAPADGEKLIARGNVVRPGRTLPTAEGAAPQVEVLSGLRDGERVAIDPQAAAQVR